MLKKLDIKTILIIILTALLVLFIIFRPSKKIDYYKDEIKALKNRNKELMEDYDSLNVENKKIDLRLKRLYKIVKDNEGIISDYNKQIIDLKQNQNDTRNKVNVLTADGVASEFTDYLKTKSGKGVRK